MKADSWGEGDQWETARGQPSVPGMAWYRHTKMPSWNSLFCAIMNLKTNSEIHYTVRLSAQMLIPLKGKSIEIKINSNVLWVFKIYKKEMCCNNGAVDGRIESRAQFVLLAMSSYYYFFLTSVAMAASAKCHKLDSWTEIHCPLEVRRSYIRVWLHLCIPGWHRPTSLLHQAPRGWSYDVITAKIIMNLHLSLYIVFSLRLCARYLWLEYSLLRGKGG
jgi:hypothetical protein